VELERCHTQQQPRFRFREHFYGLEYGVRAVCRLNHSYLLCGDDQGRLFVYDCFARQTYVLSLNHESYVARIMLDSAGNVWTAGGDGLVYTFQREELIYCIQNKQVIRQRRIKCLYQKESRTSIEVVLGEEDFRVVPGLPPKKHILAFECLSEDKFAVGYADGSVLVCWEGRQQVFSSHCEVVTALRIAGSKLYVAFYKGVVTVIDLQTFCKDNRLFDFQGPVLSLTVCQHSRGVTIEAITCEGSISKIEIDHDRNYSFHEEAAVGGLLGASFVEGSWFLLAEDGKLAHHGEEVLQCPLRSGWSCL
jgi:hypothetical protein